MSTKVLFTFEAEDLGVAKKQDEIADRMKAIRKEIEAAKKTGSPYTELLKESQGLKREQDELRKKQRELNREFAATKVPKDSLAGLRIEYAKLVDQIKLLDSAQRNSDFGKNLINQAAKAKKEIDGIEQRVGRFTGNVGNYRQAISSIAGFLPIIGAGLGASQVVESTREFERLFAVLKQATGSQSAANNIFSQIQQFAKETPFQLNELVGAFVKLEQRNFNPTIDQLRVIGDIAAASGKTFNQFTEAILDAQTGEFERLKEFGIIAKKNGDDLRVTFRGQSETFKNTSENITNYLLKIGELPGIQGSAIAVSKTLDGSISNLVDNFIQLSANIGSAGGFLKGFVDFINSGVSALNDMVAVPLSDTLREQQSEFNALIGILSDVESSETARTEAIKELKAEYPGYIGNINLESASQEELNSILQSGNQLFEKRIFLQQNEEKLVEFAKQRIQTQKLLFEEEKKLQQLQQSGQGSQASRRFSAAGAERDAPLVTLGKESEQRVQALRGQLERLNQLQADFVSSQNEISNSIFGSAESLEKFKESEKDKDGKSVIQAIGDKSTAAAGSVEFLKGVISELESEINKSDPKNPAIDGLIKKLKDAEKQLQIVEQQLKDLRNPQAQVSKFDQANAGLAELGVTISDSSKEDAAAELRALAKSLAEQSGVINLDVEADDASIQRTLNKLNELEAKNKENQDKANQKKKDDQEEVEEAIKEGAINSAQSIADAVFQIRSNELERYQSAQLDKLNEQEQKAIEAAQGNAAKEKLIREDFERRRAALEKEGARKRKEIAKKEALINTALSITKALTGAPPPFSFILAGVAAIAGAAQLAIIDSQEFWQGGKVKRVGPGKVRERQNAPRTPHGDTVLAYLAPGEMVLNEGQQNRIQAMAGRNIFAKAGVPGYANATPMPHFASGGVVGDIVPQTTSYAYAGAVGGASVQATFSDAQMITLGRIVANEVAAQVGQEVRTGIGTGLNDANRRIEREQTLQTNRRG